MLYSVTKKDNVIVNLMMWNQWQCPDPGSGGAKYKTLIK
jgi:hypothetical protein